MSRGRDRPAVTPFANEERHRSTFPDWRGDGRALAASSSSSSGGAGGADRVRTGDLLVANQALSQLSYSPGDFRVGGPKWI